MCQHKKIISYNLLSVTTLCAHCLLTLTALVHFNLLNNRFHNTFFVTFYLPSNCALFPMMYNFKMLCIILCGFSKRSHKIWLHSRHPATHIYPDLSPWHRKRNPNLAREAQNNELIILIFSWGRLAQSREHLLTNPGIQVWFSSTANRQDFFCGAAKMSIRPFLNKKLT